MNRDVVSDDKVVVSGISGRFPNADNVDELQYNLLNKVEGMTTDFSRWDLDNPHIPERLGCLNNVEKFDRVFFGVHAKLTAIMDPVSRLLLENTFEAIMDAGINPRSLRDRHIAVFSSTSISEAERNVFTRKVQHDGFGIMGSSKAMLANRISFFFGFNGPSVNIDSGHTASGSALEQGYHAVKSGRCDAAIVASGTLSLHPHVSYGLKCLGLLSDDGYTRSYDDNANGHTRSEGVTVFFLQKEKDARRIYCEIIDTRTSYLSCYNLNSLIFPKPEYQVEMMKNILQKNGLSPDDIAFLEGSGMGIKSVDTKELQAVYEVFGKRKKPLLMGSISSNIGQTVSTSTVNSILKMIIASETGQIPPNINFEKPNSEALGLKDGKIKILTELTPWTGRYCCVNTISALGTFSSTLLKTPTKKKNNNGIPDDDLPRLIIASGRTEDAVETILNYMGNRSIDAEFLQLLYDVFQSDIEGHLYRGFTIVPAKGLSPVDSKQQEIFYNTGEKKETWWVFSGMGSQWAGMGEALLRLPVFEAAIRKCDAVLKPHGFDIFKIITEKDPKMFDFIINSFIGIAAIQIGLVDVLTAVGLKPDYIIGHSVGELGCAYADGCFTAEQMIMAALSRGLASSETNLPKGSMAAVGLGYQDIKPLCPPDIDVACHNGPESSTISGPAESMKAFVAELTKKGIFAREVPCSNIAYHSRYIAAAGPKLLERLQKVIPKPNPRSSKWVSTSVPSSEWNTLKARLSSAEYHTNNLLSPVLFDETSRLIPPNAICVEIAPHGLLQAILKRSLPETCINIALTRRGHPDNLEVLLTGLGKLYNVGMQPQIANLYPKIQYPVSIGTPSISPLIRWDHTDDWLVDGYDSVDESIQGEQIFEINLNDEDDGKSLRESIMNRKILVPLSLCLDKVWNVLKSIETEQYDAVVFEEIKIYKEAVTVPDDNIIKLTVIVTKGIKKFEVLDSESIIVTGLIKSTKTPSQDRLDIPITQDFNGSKLEISKQDFYTELLMRGYKYSEDYQCVLKSSTDGSNALIKWNNNWITFIDSALQLFVFSTDLRQVEVPLIIRKIVIDNSQQASSRKNEGGVKAYLDKNINYISAGGLEIQGPKFAIIAKNLEQNILSGDSINIIPNVDKSNLAITVILRLVLQLVIENSFLTKIQRIEFVEQNETQKIKSFITTLLDIPEASLFKTEISSYGKAEFEASLTVITDDFNNYDVNELSKKIKINKFLLIFVNSSQEDLYINAVESIGLKIILLRKHTNVTVLLLRKKQSFKNIQFINISENVKEAVHKIKKLSSEIERVVAVIKSGNKKKVIEYIDQIQQLVSLEKIRIFNIHDSKTIDDSTLENMLKKQLELDLLINILTPINTWATLRRTQVILNPKLCKNWIANHIRTNNPNAITWTEGPVIENKLNTIKVEYSAINYQDILISNGTFYTDLSEISGKNRLTQMTIGLEFSGTDSKGNRIMGVSTNCMSSVINTDAEWTWPIPKSWSYEDAATVPFSYIIAYSALFVKAEIQAGETVVLCNSCDGVGLAILNIAVNKKCNVYVTYKNEIEKKLIQSTVPSLPNKRLFKLNGDSFRDTIFLETKGQGADVVICNSSKIRDVEKLFTLTKNNARVVSINDFNCNEIHENIGMEIFLREISFYSVVPKKILLCTTEAKRSLVNMIKDGINNGYVKPLARTVYSRNSLNEAFNACATNEPAGKIIVKVQPEGSNANETTAIPRIYCSNSKSYLIIEGLTDFGMELTDWLITRGARHFVIASTFDNQSGYENLRLKLWKSYGVQIILHKKCDLTNIQNIKDLFKEASSSGPIDAVFDLRLLDKKISIDSANTSIKLLDEVSKTYQSLRLFVVCTAAINVGTLTLIRKFGSSINESQNQTIEHIIENRKKNNLPGLIIKWGILDTMKDYINEPDTNIVLPPIVKYLEKLDEILGTEESVVEVSYINPHTSEVEIDSANDKLVDPERVEFELFTASLYEPGKLTSDNMAILPE